MLDLSWGPVFSQVPLLVLGHMIRRTMEGLLPPTGIEPTPYRNYASKVTGLQVHANTSRSLLLTLNIFHTFFLCLCCCLKQVNVCWVGLIVE